MHILFSIALIVSAIVLLVTGLVRVLSDLLERSPHSVPLMEEDGFDWPRRYQGGLSPQPHTADVGYAADWDQDSSRS